MIPRSTILTARSLIPLADSELHLQFHIPPKATNVGVSAMADSQPRKPHVALLPSAGMGHLVPFLRLAALLASHNCRVTFIAAKPTVSAAESDHVSEFFANHQDIRRLDFQLPPYNSSDFVGIGDPFFIQFEAINRSVHLLLPLLGSLSPPLSAIFSDFTFVANISEVAEVLSIPFYIVSTTSARFFSIMACLPHLTLAESDPKNNELIELPAGLPSIPASSLPSSFFNSGSTFAAHIITNAQFHSKAKGIIFNTFDELESETIAAVNSSRVLPNIPRFFPIGPYPSFDVAKGPYPSWLDDQPHESVLYVSFGSRTALSKEQLRELGRGLDRSGYRYLWVVKGSKVDKDDKEDIRDLVGDFFLERTKYQKGIVIKGWVDQDQILSHPAVGGFLSHCGWNSVTEAARLGIPILAWPQNGDQMANAEVAEKGGLGMRVRNWSCWNENLVTGEEIAEKIMEFMQDKTLMAGAKKVMQKAKRAFEKDGSSNRVLEGLVEIIMTLKNRN